MLGSYIVKCIVPECKMTRTPIKLNYTDIMFQFENIILEGSTIDLLEAILGKEWTLR